MTTTNLSGQGEQGRESLGPAVDADLAHAVGPLDGHAVGTRGFVTIARTADSQLGDHTEGTDDLNRLVSRTILADGNGVVGHGEDGTGLDKCAGTERSGER